MKKINAGLATMAFNGTSMDPEKRGASFIKGYESEYEKLKSDLGDYWTEATGDKLHSLYEAWLHAKSNCISSFITGPSGFPVRRAEKANNSEHNRYVEIVEFVERVKKSKKKEEKRDAIEEAGGELEIAKKKLASITKLQETMKAANKVIKSKPRNEITPEKIEKLKALGINKPEKFFIPDYMGLCGFPSFSLTNNNARIKATAARVRQLEAREANADKPDKEVKGEGVTITACYADNRLRIEHDEKPSHEVRQALKSGGFHWSRMAGAWQRQLTRNAVYSAERITGIKLT